MTRLITLTLTAMMAAGFGLAQQKTEKSGGGGGQVARGKYIVEEVAKCEFCHTPRNESGVPDRTHWLKGGPVQIKPTYPSPNWAARAPRIAGEPPGTEADFIRLLTTGIARTGQPPNPPMRQFHMTTEDAEAVYAYLKSLAP